MTIPHVTTNTNTISVLMARVVISLINYYMLIPITISATLKRVLKVWIEAYNTDFCLDDIRL